MSKLNIHKDQPQPSDEQLLKHKNFDAVLHSAKAGSVTTASSTKSFWSNPLIWIGSVIIITTGCLLIWNMDTTNEAVIETNTKMETSPSSLSVKENTSKLEVPNTVNSELTKSDTVTINYEDEKTNIPNTKDITDTLHLSTPETASITLLEPTGKVFTLSNDFNLTANFNEFEAYDQVNFQPLEKINPAYLKTAWDSAFLNTSDTGYELILHKNGKQKTVKVKPTL